MKYLPMVSSSFNSTTYNRLLTRFGSKQRSVSSKNRILLTGVYTSRNPTKPLGCENEDSCSVGASHICVADGVGGWISQGVSSALYSRQLVKYIEMSINDYTKGKKCELDREKFMEMVNKSYENMKSSKIIGSSTLCLTYLDNNKLHVFNLGDSKCVIYRKDEKEVIFESEIQQHNFNTPFQLGTGSIDTPYNADYMILEGIKSGDAIIVATDGLWDNVSMDKVIHIVDSNLLYEPQKIAEKLGREALQLSLSSKHISPYSMNLNNYLLNQRFQSNISSNRNFSLVAGGKPDDITVLIGVVQ
ncbi:PP2C phosphatase [Cryptosporidium ubiquitum]|uniref:Protein phosphatase n=1 Tax=Cryptosporidium ubiquitum TaxID=857276 RepID=A0A1J4MLA4_9CRYT|nr:PP2C phosphatase [Cryptosporidium ubiquitum]OII75025.1 PP2C phosphatase [Cryptosporidium ubiquitum]